VESISKTTPYERAIAHVMLLWQQASADKTCAACIASPRGGCCQGCKTLGTDGCTDKPMCCAIWTCAEINQKHPILQQQMNQVARALRTSYQDMLSGNIGFRQHIPELQALKQETLVQIQSIGGAQ
jgi:hypothetical protein